MKRACLAAGALAVMCACGGSQPIQPPQSASQAAPEKPVDESRRFPLADQVSMTLVDNHLLGKDFLPGGNVAEYKRRGMTYQQFLIHSKSAEAAALLLFDFKSHLGGAQFLPHMGGYFGMDGATPVYLFQKGPYLAGLAGLPEKEADPLARQFAARLE
ncbi:MAG TPA: hypothetical protein VEU62_22645 [Bryobacterales bacterium]|nr:hypothetical protein [Bryobacterales bacterium]